MFLFFGCASSLLDESQDFSIFVREILAHFCCCRCHHARFFVVVLELARVAAGMEHDRTCLFILMRNLCDRMFFWIVFKMIITVWALFLQSLPCSPVSFTAFLFIIIPTGCRRPPVLTSMPRLSWNTPLVCCCAAALQASSSDLLCYGFCKCAFSFCCCDLWCFGFCKSALFPVSCTSFPFLAAAFLLCQRFLGIFLRARTFQY